MIYNHVHIHTTIIITLINEKDDHLQVLWCIVQFASRICHLCHLMLAISLRMC